MLFLCCEKKTREDDCWRIIKLIWAIKVIPFLLSKGQFNFLAVKYISILSPESVERESFQFKINWLVFDYILLQADLYLV